MPVSEAISRWPDYSFSSPAGSSSLESRSNGTDEWSKRLDELDQLRLNMSPTSGVMDSFSDLPDITEVIADIEEQEMRRGSNQRDADGDGNYAATDEENVQLQRLEAMEEKAMQDEIEWGLNSKLV